MIKQKIHSPFQRDILLIIVILFWFSQYVYIPYQTTYLYGNGITATFVGIVLGSYGLIQLIFRMPVGLMADRIKMHKIFIIFGVLASGIASVFRILLLPGTGFLIGNFFSGLASAMWISFMVLYFSYFPENQKERASGFIVGANNFGILVGFVISTFLYERFGMKTMCYLSVISALLAFLLSLLIREPKIEKSSLRVRELVRVYTNKRLIVFSVLALIQQGIQISTSMSFTSQIAKVRGANDAQIGLCSIVYILTAVLSSYFATTKPARRFGVHFWIPTILIGLAAYCALVPNLLSVTWICVIQILSGLSTGILFSYCTSEAMKEIPEEKASTAMGFYQAVYAIGMTVFPIVTGFFSNVWSIHTAFYFLSGTAVVGAAASLLFYHRVFAGEAKG